MPVSGFPELPGAVLLCIDEDEDVLECEKSLLEILGYTVLTAASGSNPGSYAAWRAFVAFFRAMPGFFRADNAVFPALCAALTTCSLGCLAAR
jgi:hypothetical protein